jgi:hypothetical protein
MSAARFTSKGEGVKRRAFRGAGVVSKNSHQTLWLDTQKTLRLDLVVLFEQVSPLGIAILRLCRSFLTLWHSSLFSLHLVTARATLNPPESLLTISSILSDSSAEAAKAPQASRGSRPRACALAASESRARRGTHFKSPRDTDEFLC